MSEKELNSYRFTPYEEPTDEMLCQIMKEETARHGSLHRRHAPRHRRQTGKMGRTHQKHCQCIKASAFRK